jgi:hypothetical protein
MRLDMLSPDALKELTSEQEGPLVSLYIPLSAEGNANENPKRLELALADAEVRLGTMGLSPKGCAQFLAPARAYAEKHLSIPHGGKTLALLLSPSKFHAFMLPDEVAQSMQVGPHFCVAPLLPYLRKNADCHVLAVSKNHARLLHMNSEGIHEVEVDGMPGSFAKATEGDDFQDKEMQFHGGGPGGGGGTQFHGQGGASDMAKEELEDYLHKIAKGVDHALKDEKAPLFFAGIEEEFGMFRKHSKYPHLQQHFIHGNPDTLKTEDLYDKAVDLMRPLWDKEREVALEVYGPLSGTGRTSTDTQAILDLSYHGKVDGLLVAEGAMQWGRINPDSGIAELHDSLEAGDSDLIGLAAIHTLQHRGWVRVLAPTQMPEGAAMAAILRY